MEQDRNRVLQLQEKWVVPFFVAVLEVVFHLPVYGTFDGNILHGILFSLPFSLLVLFISSTGNGIWNRVIRGLFLLATVIYFAAQLMYDWFVGSMIPGYWWEEMFCLRIWGWSCSKTTVF